MAEQQLQNLQTPLGAGLYGSTALRRKSRLLLMLQTGIAGLHLYADHNSPQGKAVLAKLVPGTEVFLFRDADNEHDRWAISVFTAEDEKLGYITRFKNETIARLMDYGKKFCAYVDEAPPEPADETERRRTRAPTENFRVPLSIYMEG